MEEETKKYLENLPAPFLVVDGHYRIVYINNAGRRILNFDDSNPCLSSYVAGKNDVLKILNCLVDIAEGKSDRSTLEFEIENNEVRSAVKGDFLKDYCIDGAVQLFLTDITNLKTLEQKEINKGKYLDIVLESLPVGVTIADGNGYINHVNEKALSISGKNREEVIREFSINLFPTFEDSKGFVSKMMELLEGKTTRVIETYRFNRADGSPVKVELEIMLLEDKQGYISFMKEIKDPIQPGHDSQ